MQINRETEHKTEQSSQHTHECFNTMLMWKGKNKIAGHCMHMIFLSKQNTGGMQIHNKTSTMINIKRKIPTS